MFDDGDFKFPRIACEGQTLRHTQSQGHVKKKTPSPSVAVSLMLIACLVVEIIHGNADFFCLCRPTVTLHQGQGN